MPRRPIFTAAAWLLPALGALLTWAFYHRAVTGPNGGELMEGLGELLIGTGGTALCAFGCGLTALLRRERLRWLALPPFLAGLAAILCFLGNLLRHS